MLQLVERGFFKPTAIMLSDVRGAPASINPPVQILRTGSFNHPKYGEFSITTATLQELKANFDSKIRGVDLAVDYFHKSDEEAAGWFTELFLTEDGQELWGKVDWTKTAQMKMGEREVRYFSPDFAFQWQDPETGTVYKNVLFGGGLTNRPFVKDMAAIVAAEGKDEMDAKQFKELQDKVLKLAEDQSGLKAENEQLKKKLAEYADKAPPVAPTPKEDAVEDDEEADDVPTLKKKLADAMAMNEKLMGEAAKAKDAAKLAENTSEFNVMLSEGKVCAAQKDSFLKGDMTSFVKLAEPTNLTGAGSSAVDQGAGGETVEDRILKLAEEKAGEWKLDRVAAISKARKLVK